MSIDWITWAEDGIHFAYSDRAMITVKKISGQGMSQWKFTTVMDIDMDDSGMVQQILLDGDRLLVVLKKSAQLWSMGSLKTTVSFGKSQKWVCHPHDKKSLLALTLDTVTMYTWRDLRICEQWRISTCPPLAETPVPTLRKSPTWSNTESHEYVDEVIVSDSRMFLMLLISRNGAARKRWDRLVMIPTAFNCEKICPIDIPMSIASSIEKPLGMLVGERLVFVNKEFWVCSWPIRGEKEVKKHFFLPRDWVDVEVLGLCRLLGEGKILCPRKGDVAVVKEGMW